MSATAVRTWGFWRPTAAEPGSRTTPLTTTAPMRIAALTPEIRRRAPGTSLAELVGMAELAELRDVTAEEEGHRPVDDDPELPLRQRELVQVVGACHPPAEEAVQVEAQHLRDPLVPAQCGDLAEHAIAIRLGRSGEIAREPASLAEGV